MTTPFTPHLEILPPPQRQLWEELAPIPPTFILYGGTAIGLHLGHRTSIDFDFFSNHHFDPDELFRDLPFLAKAQVLQKKADTLTCQLNREGPVQISFFGLPELGRIKEPLTAPGINLHVASLIDLAGMKAAVVQKRAEAKDYLDIQALIDQGGITLSMALTAGKKIYGHMFNPFITLKALSCYTDGNLSTVPQKVRDHLLAAVKNVDLGALPRL